MASSVLLGGGLESAGRRGRLLVWIWKAFGKSEVNRLTVGWVVGEEEGSKVLRSIWHLDSRIFSDYALDVSSTILRIARIARMVPWSAWAWLASGRSMRHSTCNLACRFRSSKVASK